MLKLILKYSQIITLPLLLTGVVACDRWDETSDVSHVSHLPEFEFDGGDFITVVKSEIKYTDTGVKALVNGTPVNWYYLLLPPDSLNNPGLYVVRYYAENKEGFSKTADRLIVVTYDDISNNDLSGTYYRNVWGPVQMEVTRVNDQGLYKCEDVLGFPGAPMPGRFADIGNQKLVLVPGDGFFGEYDASEGEYTQRFLAWDVTLLDPPNTGVTVPVIWQKID